MEAMEVIEDFLLSPPCLMLPPSMNDIQRKPQPDSIREIRVIRGQKIVPSP